MTYAEPNALPPAYSSWHEWRTSYTEFVAEFKASPKSASDELQLKIRLQRMGYVGVRLGEEIRYVRDGNGT